MQTSLHDHDHPVQPAPPGAVAALFHGGGAGGVPPAGASPARGAQDVPDALEPAAARAAQCIPSKPLDPGAPQAPLLAPQGRILDTLRTARQDTETPAESADELLPSSVTLTLADGRTVSLAALAAGQVVMDLPGVPAQLGLDRVPYEPPASPAAPHLYDPDHLEDVPLDAFPSQVAFDFVKPVQMSFDAYRAARVKALGWLARLHRRGPLRSALAKAAERASFCGTVWQLLSCEDCGCVDAKTHRRVATCDGRTCPACARKMSLELRARLLRAMKLWPSSGRGMTWWFHTVTVRRDLAEGTSVERLMRDRERALAGWRSGWKVLRSLGAERAIVSQEVAPGGMVHLHILAYHDYLRPEQLADVRAAILDTIGGGTTQYRVERVKGNRKAVAEIAKYLVKGVASSSRSSEQTHPVLAALVELAWRQKPRTLWYGNWKGLDTVEVDADAQDGVTWKCPGCGSTHYRVNYCDGRQRPLDREDRPPPRRRRRE